MDPLTQGTLGAVMPQTVAKKEQAGMAMLCGFLAGMAPDLDVLIQSTEDPLLFLEYHRQFTHSLIFIPLGAALVGAVLWGVWGRWKHWSFRSVYGYCLLGYATHALLDACTSYGTLLFWPFSDVRIAWNTVSIIDPLFTLPLLLCSVMAFRRRSPWPARLGLAWAVLYLCLGALARDAAQDVGMQLARERGHSPVRVEAKPSFANIVLWKTVYRYEDRYFVDAVRLGGEPAIYEGESVQALALARDLPWLDPDSKQARDVERFSWFSMGYLALDPQYENRVMDIRYSLLPDEIRPLWSIQLDPQSRHDSHVRYISSREGAGGRLKKLLNMLQGKQTGE